MSCHGDCSNCETKHEENKRKIILLIISIIIFVIGFFVNNQIAKIILAGISTILVGYEVLLEGIKTIFKLDFEEDTLMTIAVIAAFALGEFPEAFLVLLLFEIGEYLEDKAREKSHKNIEDIVSLKENKANVEENGSIVTKDSKDINIGETILIKPGERVPLDCVITSGRTELDTSAITGESKNISVKER